MKKSVDANYMDIAMDEARAAAERGEVPVGAVLVGADGTVLARDGNRIMELGDATAHAEILVLRAGARALGSERLLGASLYVTLEPCTMCAGAIAMSRVARVYYGAADQKGGAVESGVRFFSSPTCHHKPEVYSGIGEKESANLLKEFFEKRRV